MRWSEGTLPTDRQFTGQRLEAGPGLYDYKARYYDPAIGRFVQPDAVVPEPGNPQALNRYAYVNNNPLTYIDDEGHLPIIPILIVGGIVALKAIDYGWTAYDAWQASRVLADPNAPRSDRLMAGLTVALSVGFEAVEPDEWLPAGLPIDDVARRALVKGAREAFEEGGIEGLESYIRSHLGEHADEVLDRVYKSLCCSGQRHHVLSSKILKALEEHPTLRGVFQRDDIIVQALEKANHWGYQSWHRAYDKEVVKWLQEHQQASREEFLNFLIELYSRPDMRRRFPHAVETLKSLLK